MYPCKARDILSRSTGLSITTVEKDGQIIASADVCGYKQKRRLHRAELGISVRKDYWNQGIGSAMMERLIAFAVRCGYEQIELSVVAENEPAIAMYEKAGFVEFGRNPRGFKSRFTGYQELVYMRKEL